MGLTEKDNLGNKKARIPKIRYLKSLPFPYLYWDKNAIIKMLKIEYGFTFPNGCLTIMEDLSTGDLIYWE